MKQFNRFSDFKKWVISVLFTITIIAIILLWVKAFNETKLWALFIFVMVPIIQFFITPVFTLLGFYTYYSPMVVSMSNNKSYIDLHNGTSFDYLLEMSKVKPGVEWKNRMLYHYLSALLNITNQIEANELPNDVVVRGSSYFLSKRSAQKLGFRTEKTSWAEKINIVMNYLDLIWMYSLSNGKLTFPNLNNITTAKIDGNKLLKSKNRLQALANRLK